MESYDLLKVIESLGTTIKNLSPIIMKKVEENPEFLISALMALEKTIEQFQEPQYQLQLIAEVKDAQVVDKNTGIKTSPSIVEFEFRSNPSNN